MYLIDRRTEDGSRHFANLPKACTWEALCEHILRLPGAKVTNFVTSSLADAWLDFAYAGYRFLVSQQGGSYCFFVSDPTCPDLNLFQVARHCEELASEELGSEELAGEE